MTKNYRTPLLLFALVLAFYSSPMWAQSGYPCGCTVAQPVSSSCASGTYSDPNNPAVCYSTTVTCPNTNTISVTYSVDTPPTPKGTIVLFSGGGGTTPSDDVGQEYAFAQDYLIAGYQVVQFAWSADWENTNLPVGLPNAYNIATAACRPATFLNYIYTNYFQSLSNPRAGMCAQGSSGGSSAIAYALVWYNAATYLNNAELLSGPTFSDIKFGCAMPPANNVSICANNQWGCSSGTLLEVQQTAWVRRPSYLVDWRDAVATFTNDQTCASGPSTSSDSNARWKAQSILPGRR